MAEINGFSGGLLSNNEGISEKRNLWPFQSVTTCGSIDSFKYCGGTQKDFVRFLDIAKGSIHEVQYFIHLSERLECFSQDDAEKLLAGQISATLRSEIGGMLAQISNDQSVFRAAETIYLIVTSPEYAYQR